MCKLGSSKDWQRLLHLGQAAFASLCLTHMFASVCKLAPQGCSQSVKHGNALLLSLLDGPEENLNARYGESLTGLGPQKHPGADDSPMSHQVQLWASSVGCSHSNQSKPDLMVGGRVICFWVPTVCDSVYATAHSVSSTTHGVILHELISMLGTSPRVTVCHIIAFDKQHAFPS